VHPRPVCRTRSQARLSVRVMGISSGLVAGALCRGATLTEGTPSGLAGARDQRGGTVWPNWQFPLRAVRVSAGGDSPAQAPTDRRPIVVCGPSGVGKGTLLGKLLADFPNDYGFSVSHTTRAPRPGEQDGVHYHFVPKEEMEGMIARGEFVEYARVHTNIYGTSIAAVQAVSDKGKACLLDIDVQGAEIVKRTDLNARFIFIAPPSFEELERRLRGRGTETEDKIQVRLKTARVEMDYLTKPGFFDQVIVNNDLDKAFEEFKAALRG